MAEEEQALRSIVRERGWTTMEVFAEAPPHVRTARQRLLQTVSDADIGIVVAASIASFSDSLADFMDVADHLRLSAVRLVLVEDDLDTAVGDGRHLLPALPILRHIAVTFRAEAALVGIGRARSDGVRLGRPPLDPTRKARAAELLRNGIGVRDVARQLSMPQSEVSRIKNRAEEP